MIQVESMVRPVVMTVVLGFVAQIALRHVDLMPISRVVAQLVDGVGDGVSLDDEPGRRARTSQFDQPRLAEPVTGFSTGMPLKSWS